MSSYDVRREAYNAGMATGAKDERARIADLLEDMVGSADLEGQVLALVSELQAKPATSATVTTEQLVARAQQVSATQAKGDLGDQIVALMMERRGKHHIHGAGK